MSYEYNYTKDITDETGYTYDWNKINTEDELNIFKH